jgi:transposase
VAAVKRGRRQGKLEEAVAAREARQSRVAKMLRGGGWTPRSIAKQLGVSLSTVQRDIKTITDALRSQSPEAFAASKRYAQERLDYIVREADAAWKRSQGQIVKRKIKGRVVREADGKWKVDTSGGKNGKDATILIEEYEAAGDPRYLEVMRAAIADYRKCLGIDEPERHEHTGPGGEPLSLLGLLQDYEAKGPEVVEVEAEVTKALPTPEEVVPETEETKPNSSSSP